MGRPGSTNWQDILLRIADLNSDERVYRQQPRFGFANVIPKRDIIEFEEASRCPLLIAIGFWIIEVYLRDACGNQRSDERDHRDSAKHNPKGRVDGIAGQLWRC